MNGFFIGGKAIATLHSYNGGVGQLTLHQGVEDPEASMMVVLFDLEPERQYSIELMPRGTYMVDDCPLVISELFNKDPEEIERSTNSVASRLPSNQLMQLNTDYTGLAVVPWKQMNGISLYGTPKQSALDRLVVVYDSSSQKPILCGVLLRTTNFSEYASKVVTSTASTLSFNLIILMLLAIACTSIFI